MTEQTKIVDKALPEFLHLMEISLRSGYNIRQSLEMMCNDGSESLVAMVQPLVEALDGGTSLPEVLDNWLASQPSLALDLIVNTFHVQFESGGNLANKLRFISQLLPKLKHSTSPDVLS